jgi:hypothetical protein
MANNAKIIMSNNNVLNRKCLLKLEVIISLVLFLKNLLFFINFILKLQIFF